MKDQAGATLHRPAHGGHPTPPRICHFCKEPIEVERAIRAKTGSAWAHFSCWYDGRPVEGPDGKVI